MHLLWLLLSTLTHADCKDYFAHILPSQRAKRFAEVKREIEGGEPPEITSWSFTANADSNELGPGVRRVGPEKIAYLNRQGSGPASVEIRLPNGQMHTVRLTGNFVAPETRQFVAEFLALLPENHVQLLAEIHVPKTDLSERFTDAYVNPLQPTVIYLLKDTRLNLGEVLSHEFGHVSDLFHTYLLPWQSGPRRLRKKWQQAIAADGKSISKYGDTKALEDFAEAVARYLEPNEALRQSFREHFPHRTQFLDEYFANAPGRRGGFPADSGKLGAIIGVPGALIVTGSYAGLQKYYGEPAEKPAPRPTETKAQRGPMPASALIWH